LSLFAVRTALFTHPDLFLAQAGVGGATKEVSDAYSTGNDINEITPIEGVLGWNIGARRRRQIFQFDRASADI
jgi:hypothetical protein